MDEKGGYFTDEGEEVNPDLIPKPGLCLLCQKDDDPNEEMLCNLNRLDQKDSGEFRCFAYQSKK
ncbi:MAG: hypothetical protein Q8O74_08795 [bacterium]|nr:hypothetical protein [bacterium]